MNSIVNEMTSFLVMDVLEKAKEMQQRGIDVIHLEVGEPDFDVPDCVNQAVKDALDNHETHYTHSLGLIELRKETLFVSLSKCLRTPMLALLQA